MMAAVFDVLSPPAGLTAVGFNADMCWKNAFFCYCLTSYLLLTHGHMVMLNETSIEAYAKSELHKLGRKPSETFDRGWRENFQEVFGPCNPWSLRWLWPFVV